MMPPPLPARWVEARFGMPSPTVSLLRGYTNDVYLVESSSGRFVLKVYGAGWRTDDEIRWEIDLLSHLRDHGASVTAPIPDIDGDPLQVLSAEGTFRQAVLFEHAAGHKPQPPFSTAMYRRQGQMTATVHRASDGFVSRHDRPPLDLTCLIDRPLDVIKTFDADGRVTREVTEIGYRIRASMAPLIQAGLDWGICHGDLTFDNVHITNSGRSVLFDFDSGGPGWRAIDLQGWAVFVPGREGDWRAFLDGYRSVRPLGEADVVAAPLLALADAILGMQIDLERRWAIQGDRAIAAYLADAVETLRQQAGAIELAG